MPMPLPHPFLTEPHESGQHTRAETTDALFDLAVNRAALALRAGQLKQILPAWHARTRFARRVPLVEIEKALLKKPATGQWHWSGGVGGAWKEGKAAFP